MGKADDIMTIRHLRIFIEVADCGKMSAAAEKLFISQPTVSQAIKELEEHYGVLLFERLNKRLYITEKGKKLLSYARKVVKQFYDMEEMMLQETYVEKIRIGATITVGTCILSEIIKKFKQTNSHVEIYSYVGNTRDIEERILTSELDIGIVEGRVKSPDLVSIPELNDFLVLVCSMDHPFAKMRSIKIEDLENKKFAMREQGSGTRELFERYMLEKGISIKTAFEANSTTAIKKSVMENNLLAVISVRLLEEEIRGGKIYPIINSDHKWNRFFSIVYHKDKIITKEMRDLIEVVNNYKHIDILEGINVGMLIT